MNKLTSFGIWANTDKPSFWKVLPDIVSWAKNKSIDLYITTRIESKLNDKDLDLLQQYLVLYYAIYLKMQSNIGICLDHLQHPQF